MKADEYNVRIVFGNDKKPSRYYSYCDDPKFMEKQSASLNRMLALVRSGVLEPTLLSEYAEWDEFREERHRALQHSASSEWAELASIAIPEHIQEFVNTGGAAQRRADLRKAK